MIDEVSEIPLDTQANVLRVLIDQKFKRLKNVKEALERLGIKKINTHVMLEVNPIASNKTKRGRLLNRRIEFKVKKEDK